MMTKEDLRTEGVDNLCAAIVERATKDYFDYRFYLDTLELRKQVLSNKKPMAYYSKFIDTLAWFDSELFHMICPFLKFEDMMDILNNRYYDEEFLNRLTKYANQKGIPTNRVNKFRIKFNLTKANDKMPVNEMLKLLKEVK